MPNESKINAYRLAQQMDQQQARDEAENRKEQLEQFLNTISKIESSGGKNFDHDLITSGIHKGHKAVGSYGLMPNTIYEVLNRMRIDGSLPQELQHLEKLKPQQVKQVLEGKPDQEKMIAEYLGQKVLNRQGGDEEKAAYSWFQGHNLTPQEINQREYSQHDYVNKYRKYRGDK